MIEKDGFFWSVQCEHCSNSEDDIDTDTSFASVVDEIKSRGWRITKIDGDWAHICPVCAS